MSRLPVSSKHAHTIANREVLDVIDIHTHQPNCWRTINSLAEYSRRVCRKRYGAGVRTRKFTHWADGKRTVRIVTWLPGGAL